MANKPIKTLNFGGEDTYYLNPDFENISNAPFETVGGDTLTWDGNTEGLPVVDLDGELLYKVSDAAPTYEELSKGGTAKIKNIGIVTFSTDDLMQGEGYIYVAGAGISITQAEKASTALGITFPETGLWLFNEFGMYIEKLTINGYMGFNTTRIKEECLPAAIMYIYVSFTGIDEHENLEGVAATKTYEEIIEAINSGKGVTAVLKLSALFPDVADAYMPLTAVSKKVCEFQASVGVEGGNLNVRARVFADGTVDVQMLP